MIKQFFLNLSIPGWIFFVLFWFFILICIFYYRKNLPPLSLLRNIFLTSLRSFILIVVFFLILHPILQFIIKNEEVPTVAVLIDNSGSMLIEDFKSIRKDSVEYILKNNLLNEHYDSIDVRYYLFDHSVKRKINHVPDFSGQQTNISTALEQVNDSLFQENLQSIVLISDGIYNEGSSPLRFAQKSPVPIHAVLIGDSITGKDLKISGVRVSRISYAGDEIPIVVNISQVGYENDKVYVRLYKGNRQILFIVDNAKVKEIEVVTGKKLGNLTEITRGIGVGQQVIISPPASLKAGDKIKIIE